VANINATRSAVPPAARFDLYQPIADTVAEVPGISQAAGSLITPVTGDNWWTPLEVPGAPDLSESDRRRDINIVSPRWFATYGMRVVAGRDFSAHDRANAERVAIVNEAFAERFFPGRQALGGAVVFPATANVASHAPRTIVGVVSDAVYRSPRDPKRPALYEPLAQHDWPFPFAGIGLSVRSIEGSPRRAPWRSSEIGLSNRRPEPQLVPGVRRQKSAVVRAATSQIKNTHMPLRPFALERYFAPHEPGVPYLFSSSDCEPLSLERLLTLADQKTLELWKRLRLGYTDSQGLPALREEIARPYVGLSADDVVVVVPEEGILLGMHALLRPGDHIITTFPGYQSLYEIARDIGCAIDHWTPAERDGWRFDPAALDHLVKPATRLLVMNFPHNPTGYLPSPDEFQQIVTWAHQRNIRIFSDEMYRLLEFDPADRLPSMVDCDERALVLAPRSSPSTLPGFSETFRSWNGW
jgi:hypothetical protein